MITAIFSFLIFSFAVYVALSLFFKKINNIKKLIISSIVFLVLSVSFITLVVLIGDKPAPGSIIVNMDDIDKNTGTYKTNKPGN